MKNNLYRLYVLIGGVGLFSSAVRAADEATASVTKDVLTSQAIMQMLLGLALVVVVILVLAWVLRRFSNLHHSHQKMKVVSSLSLGTRERAVLIEVGDRQLLLGVASGSVSLLASFPEKVITSVPKSEFSKTLKASIKESADAGGSK